MRMFARVTALLLALLLMVSCAASADEAASGAPELRSQGLALGASAVYYPQLEGMADAELQASINARILEAGSIESLLTRLSLVFSGPTPLRVTYDAFLAGDVLSCAMLAQGPVVSDRPTQVWSGLNIDLRTGSGIGPDALFSDAQASAFAIEAYLEERVAPELSFHLQNSDLLPLPQVCTFDRTGLTLRYPISQLSTLSDRAGTVTILWYELADCLDLSEDSVLTRIGADAFVHPNEAASEQIRACVSAGMLPGIPAVLGASMTDLVDAFRMLTDPDLYEGGRMFALEDGRFRDAWVLTDALSAKSYDQSIVQGLRSDRISLWGLSCGVTERGEARAVLGEPDRSLVVSSDLADLYRIEPGESDYYRMGDYLLRLHFDAEGVLSSVFLTY